MKISKRQLRRIIKEEKANVLAEQRVRRVVRRRLIEQATYDQASDLLSKLSRNPNDSASLDKLEDMVRGLGSSNERDEALDALANIEYADSEDEREEAVDYATDYVRDAFRASRSRKSHSKGTGTATMNRDKWKTWGMFQYGLEPEYDNDGQLIYYTDNPTAAKDAESLDADVQEDNMGQYVIYTGTYDKGRAR